MDILWGPKYAAELLIVSDSKNCSNLKVTKHLNKHPKIRMLIKKIQLKFILSKTVCKFTGTVTFLPHIVQ